MWVPFDRDEEDNSYTIAIKILAAAIAEFDPDAVYEMIEEEGGSHILHDVRVAIAKHHPRMHAELQKLIASS